MVNSESLESDGDGRKTKDAFVQHQQQPSQSQRKDTSIVVVGAGQSSNIATCAVSPRDSDYGATTRTADATPLLTQAIEPTATKTEYNSTIPSLMSALLHHQYKASHDVKELTSSFTIERRTTYSNDDAYDYNKTSLYCSLPLNKVQEVLSTNRRDDEDGKKTCRVVTATSSPLTTASALSSPSSSVSPLSSLASSSSSPASNSSSSITSKPTKSKLLCLYCERTFVTPNLKLKHVDRCHSVKQERRCSSRFQNQPSSTACTFCNTLNDTEHSLNDLFRHLVNGHPTKYFGCLPCEERFATHAALLEHNALLHGTDAKKRDDRTGYVANKSNGGQKTKGDERVAAVTVHNPQPAVEKRTQNKRIQAKVQTNKKVGVKSVKLGVRRTTRLQTKMMEMSLSKGGNAMKRRTKNGRSKNESYAVASAMSTTTTSYVSIASSSNLPVSSSSSVASRRDDRPHHRPTFHFSFDNLFTTYKKITDHSIDNLRISTLTFDDVFDKAFYNKIKCNIQENLLNHLDGKLFNDEESENRISNFEKTAIPLIDLQPNTTDNYGCELSLNAATPIPSTSSSTLTSSSALTTTAISTATQLGDDIESQIEYGSKASNNNKKKNNSNATKTDEVHHYKYFTRRKYQATLLENKENRDLSKLDMWTQLIVKTRQQKIINETKSEKEMLEYTRGEEYKSKIQRDELNRILDKRGPFEDLKIEASKMAASCSNVNNVDAELFADVRDVLDDLIENVAKIKSEPIEECASTTIGATISYGHQRFNEIPNFLNLKKRTTSSIDNVIDQSDRITLICSSQETENFEEKTTPMPSTVRDGDEMVELTGEWTRSRIFVCAACGSKVNSAKSLIDHKSTFHQYVWCQHYEFVGNQGELYRHLSIPGLGKVGLVEQRSIGKLWKRSGARQCSKCKKQCNTLGELHRHILECGEDWSWMLARKKCKYRPFGSRRKRRGLVKRIIHKDNAKPEIQEKKKYIKKMDGPRTKPSDADTIQRMLANLPPKRTTRKPISLKDGLQRTNLRPTNSTKKPKNKQPTAKNNLKNGTVRRAANKNKKNNANGTSSSSNNNMSLRQRNKAALAESTINEEDKVKRKNGQTRLRKSFRNNVNKVLSCKILDTSVRLKTKQKLRKFVRAVSQRKRENVRGNSVPEAAVTAARDSLSDSESRPNKNGNFADIKGDVKQSKRTKELSSSPSPANCLRNENVKKNAVSKLKRKVSLENKCTELMKTQIENKMSKQNEKYPIAKTNKSGNSIGDDAETERLPNKKGPNAKRSRNRAKLQTGSTEEIDKSPSLTVKSFQELNNKESNNVCGSLVKAGESSAIMMIEGQSMSAEPDKIEVKNQIQTTPDQRVANVDKEFTNLKRKSRQPSLAETKKLKANLNEKVNEEQCKTDVFLCSPEKEKLRTSNGLIKPPEHLLANIIHNSTELNPRSCSFKLEKIQWNVSDDNNKALNDKPSAILTNGVQDVKASPVLVIEKRAEDALVPECSGSCMETIKDDREPGDSHTSNAINCCKVDQKNAKKNQKKGRGLNDCIAMLTNKLQHTNQHAIETNLVAVKEDVIKTQPESDNVKIAGENGKDFSKKSDKVDHKKIDLTPTTDCDKTSAIEPDSVKSSGEVISNANAKLPESNESDPHRLEMIVANAIKKAAAEAMRMREAEKSEELANSEKAACENIASPSKPVKKHYEILKAPEFIKRVSLDMKVPEIKRRYPDSRGNAINAKSTNEIPKERVEITEDYKSMASKTNAMAGSFLDVPMRYLMPSNYENDAIEKDTEAMDRYKNQIPNNKATRDTLIVPKPIDIVRIDAGKVFNSAVDLNLANNTDNVKNIELSRLKNKGMPFLEEVKNSFDVKNLLNLQDDDNDVNYSNEHSCKKTEGDECLMNRNPFLSNHMLFNKQLLYNEPNFHLAANPFYGISFVRELSNYGEIGPRLTNSMHKDHEMLPILKIPEITRKNTVFPTNGDCKSVKEPKKSKSNKTEKRITPAKSETKFQEMSALHQENNVSSNNAEIIKNQSDVCMKPAICINVPYKEETVKNPSPYPVDAKDIAEMANEKAQTPIQKPQAKTNPLESFTNYNVANILSNTVTKEYLSLKEIEPENEDCSIVPQQNPIESAILTCEPVPDINLEDSNDVAKENIQLPTNCMENDFKANNNSTSMPMEDVMKPLENVNKNAEDVKSIKLIIKKKISQNENKNWKRKPKQRQRKLKQNRTIDAKEGAKIESIPTVGDLETTQLTADVTNEEPNLTGQKQKTKSKSSTVKPYLETDLDEVTDEKMVEEFDDKLDMNLSNNDSGVFVDDKLAEPQTESVKIAANSKKKRNNGKRIDFSPMQDQLEPEILEDKPIPTDSEDEIPLAFIASKNSNQQEKPEQAKRKRNKKKKKMEQAIPSPSIKVNSKNAPITNLDLIFDELKNKVAIDDDEVIIKPAKLPESQSVTSNAGKTPPTEESDYFEPLADINTLDSYSSSDQDEDGNGANVEMVKEPVSTEHCGDLKICIKLKELVKRRRGRTKRKFELDRSNEKSSTANNKEESTIDAEILETESILNNMSNSSDNFRDKTAIDAVEDIYNNLTENEPRATAEDAKKKADASGQTDKETDLDAAGNDSEFDDSGFKETHQQNIVAAIDLPKVSNMSNTNETETSMQTLENEESRIENALLVKPLDGIVEKSKKKQETTDKTPKSKRKKKVSTKEELLPEDTYCDICNKTFVRAENLLKHKRTFTHIAKLSEIEAKEDAERKRKLQESEESLKINETMNIIPVDNVEESKESSKGTEKDEILTDIQETPDDKESPVLNSTDLTMDAAFSSKIPFEKEKSFNDECSIDKEPSIDLAKEQIIEIKDDETSEPMQKSDISISNILNKPNEMLIISPKSILVPPALTSKDTLKLADIINDVLNKPVNETDAETLTNPNNNYNDNHEVPAKRYKSLGERKSFEAESANLSYSELIAQKQISLLENMIEENNPGFNNGDYEETSNASNPSEMRIVIHDVQDEEDDPIVVETQPVEGFIKPIVQYEEISEEDSSNLRANGTVLEEQTTRKVLNRDEELFLECCSLLKSSSEMSNYSKKSTTTTTTKTIPVFDNFKPMDEPDWLERKPVKPDFENDCNLYSDASNVNNDDYSCSSNVVWHEKPSNGAEPIRFEDISMDAADSRISNDRRADTYNFQVAFHHINDEKQTNEHAETIVVPDDDDERVEGKKEKSKLVERFGGLVAKAFKRKFQKKIKKQKPETVQKQITDYLEKDNVSVSSDDLSSTDNKKMLTKGAMKIFEGLKVSIPTDELDMTELLNCSPPSTMSSLTKLGLHVNNGNATTKLIKDGPILNNSFGNKLGLKVTKKKVHHGTTKRLSKANKNCDKTVDIYDFEETQDNTDVFTSNITDLKTFRNRTKVNDVSSSKDDEQQPKQLSRDASFTYEVESLSSYSAESSDTTKKSKPKNVATKKKCMIMGRIFKNAFKSKTDDPVDAQIPSIDHAKFVEDYVIECPVTITPQVPVNPQTDEKPAKISNAEMDKLFDRLLHDTAPVVVQQLQQHQPKQQEQHQIQKQQELLHHQQQQQVDNKKCTKLAKKSANITHNGKGKKRRSEDTSDDEFNISKSSRKRNAKRNGKADDAINLEQELRECIGVASRKSQRKCTSGKQNVLVEYWSSDESNFESFLEDMAASTAPTFANNPKENVAVMEPTAAPPPSTTTTSTPVTAVTMPSQVAAPETTDTATIATLTPDEPAPTDYALTAKSECNKKRKVSITKRKKSIGSSAATKQPSKHSSKSKQDRQFKKPSILIMQEPNGTADTLIATRKKRNASDTLYYWSSSSEEDELQDMIEVKPIRDEEDYDDEDRPMQHGWIVGDSPKKLVTLLAHAKGKKSENATDCVKEQSKKRTTAV